MKFNISRPGCRLLTYLKEELQGRFTTKQLRWLVEHNRCRLNGFVERFCSTKLRKGDQLSLALDHPAPALIEPERILSEDDCVLFYNKPAYLTSEDLSALLGYPLVHRLDRDTTGVMLFAKTPEIQHEIEQLFKERAVRKKYLAWVYPPPSSPSGTITFALAKHALPDGTGISICSPRGKEAVTDWKIHQREKGRALLSISPKTGRMHQIRVHLKAIGSPVMGDTTYGGREQEAYRPLLHAHSIALSLRGQSYHVIAPLPEDFS